MKEAIHNTFYTLDQLKTGEWAKVSAVRAEPSMKRRMEELGVIPGTEVCCLMESPLKDPKAYRIRGAVIALRGKDAAGIVLENPCTSCGERDHSEGRTAWD